MARRWGKRQLGPLIGPPARAVRRGQWRSWWLGPAGGLAVVVLALAFRTHGLRGWVFAAAVPRASDPWAVLAMKLPLSMFAPAQMLPFAFAVVQVAVVFGAAQVLLGWRATVAVAFAGHVLATVSARAWIAMEDPIGLDGHFRHFPDAGPSAAVICLIGYVAWSRGMTWLAVTLVVYDAVEIAVFNGLSQREHLVGLAAGFALCAAQGWLRQQSGTPARADPLADPGTLP
ncbi:hypothetical protein [Longispora fulva]|uniref:Uncharacterized protein n=1 Tax=Longispora fulva TaxID=619741 RepID=A0A8J7GE87_9ACTN|nr:hypothetical protein [Longispora fulva]MBG6136255.1 hypothetical protein [Longispora fulva]